MKNHDARMDAEIGRITKPAFVCASMYEGSKCFYENMRIPASQMQNTIKVWTDASVKHNLKDFSVHFSTILPSFVIQR